MFFEDNVDGTIYDMAGPPVDAGDGRLMQACLTLTGRKTPNIVNAPMKIHVAAGVSQFFFEAFKALLIIFSIQTL